MATMLPLSRIALYAVPNPPFPSISTDALNKSSNSNLLSPSKNTIFSRKPATVSGGLPVNVSDWSKILKDEYRDNRRRSDDDYEDDGGEDEEDESAGNRIPPHEFLARTRISSFSMHEGVGRTLKGRDFSRVRNAIWQKTGFQD